MYMYAYSDRRVPWASMAVLALLWVPSDVDPLISAKAVDDSASVLGVVASGTSSRTRAHARARVYSPAPRPRRRPENKIDTML